MYEFFQGIGQNIVNSIQVVIWWLASFFQDIWQGFKDFVVAIFKPLILFVQGLWYLLEKCFDIVVLSVQCVFGLFKVLGSVIFGVFNTFAQLLGFSGSTDYYYMPGAYQQGFDGVSNFFSQTGLNVVATIMMAFIWILTAYALIRIAGGER
ncbi:MAG: hypothetical protein PHY48_15500 [Candidatus Cloacimonetes bacterium]|nr:hypothetical protein [Candidatus Cloacimonadota bacterium]